MRYITPKLILLILLPLLCCSRCFAIVYKVTILDDPKGKNFLEARALNNRGEVVGVSVQKSARNGMPAWHGFLFHQNKYGMIDLPQGCLLGDAVSINDHGAVVGTASFPGGASVAYEWKAGRITLLKCSGAASAIGINNRGAIVGWSVLPGGKSAATVWISSSKSPLQLPQYSKAVAISSSGEILVNSASGCYVLHPQGSRYAGEKIGSLGGGDTTGMALGIRGQAAGLSMTAAGLTHAFLWEKGAMQDISAVRAPDKTEPVLTIYGINSRGQMVGTIRNGTDCTAMFFANGRQYNLNHFIPKIGLKLDIARGINDRGQIIGQGHIGGRTVSFILTPAAGE